MEGPDCETEGPDYEMEAPEHETKGQTMNLLRASSALKRKAVEEILVLENRARGAGLEVRK